ncbi:MAG: 23S rRNA pseudouridine(1911/1915/1917) synthase RluD [Arsenophonus sp.]|nr:MAG: 23S rRNA pseudouridine(1911/1915/1917) synthase RluD [Arsenophonus sp.]
MLKFQGKFTKLELGHRLDYALSKKIQNTSRSQIKKYILKNKIKINQCIINKPSYKIKGHEIIDINSKNLTDFDFEPQNIPLNIIYNDDEILIINKPSNFVVHPGSGNLNNTLVNALLFHYPNNIHIPRYGIVHRLDKNTTGLMLIAKTKKSYYSLVNQFIKKKITRQYEAIVHGVIPCDGIINQPIGRHPIKRTKMAIHHNGKNAITHYKIIENLIAFTHIKLILGTGRTHQIRVHMSYINHAIVGDHTYKCKIKKNNLINKNIKKFIQNFPRQALHAKILHFYHPKTKKLIKIKTKLPKDIKYLKKYLKMYLLKKK